MNWRMVLISGIFLLAGLVSVTSLSNEVTLTGTSTRSTDVYEDGWLNNTDVNFVSNAETQYSAPPWTNQSSENLTISNGSLQAEFYEAVTGMLFDGFEDGDASEWDGSIGVTQELDSGNIVPYEGSYMGDVPESGSGSRPVRLTQGDTISLRTSHPSGEPYRPLRLEDEDGDRFVEWRFAREQVYINGDTCSEKNVGIYQNNSWYQVNITFVPDGVNFVSNVDYDVDTVKDCTSMSAGDVERIRTINDRSYDRYGVDTVHLYTILEEARYASSGRLVTPTFEDVEDSELLTVMSQLASANMSSQGTIRFNVTAANTTAFDAPDWQSFTLQDGDEKLDTGILDLNGQYMKTEIMFDSTNSDTLANYSLTAQYGDGIDRTDGLYNVREDSEGNLEINDTTVTATEYSEDLTYTTGSGVFRSDVFQSDNPIQLSSVDVNTDDIINGKSKATLYVNYYRGSDAVEQKSFSLEQGYNSVEALDTNTTGINGYSFDILLETSASNTNPEVRDVSVEKVESERVFSGVAESLMYTVLMIVFVAISMTVLAKSL